jgi:hypothetical protein
MAIKRYYASADTTIANAFKTDLSTRGTGSNMGASDILESFTLYGQASSSSGLSAEKSRILIKFPTADMTTDRTAGNIAASGSVSWILKLYNAAHSQNVPNNMFLAIHPITSDWHEGRGLDMEGYSFKGFANWVVARSGSSGMGTAATATIQFNSATVSDYDDKTVTITSTDGTAVVYTLNDDSTSNTYGDSTTSIGIQGVFGAPSKIAELFTTAVNHSSNAHADKITAVEGTSATVTLTQDASGLAGNNTVATSDSTNITVSGFTAGDGTEEWTAEGGDWTEDGKWAQNTASFGTGTEDIEIDISDLVEVGWLDGNLTNYGLILKMPEHTETAISSSYTKRFFSRESEFFYRRPVIEARWDSTVKDDRGSFYLSSSLASSENINSLYLYNYIRGQLRSIPAVYGSTSDMATYSPLTVAIYSGSATTGPTGSALQIKDEDPAAPSSVYAVTASATSTGVYRVQLACTSSVKSTESLFDVWFLGADPGGASSTDRREQVHTGSAITSKKFDQGYAWTADPTPQYVISPINMKSAYSTNEKARFRFFARKRDWSPTIYNRASANLDSEIMESGSFRIFRVADGLNAVPFGTGSSAHTQMSYDASGSFFDIDLSILEPGYSYGVQLAYYNGSVKDWVEIPYEFKFRVEEP